MAIRSNRISEKHLWKKEFIQPDRHGALRVIALAHPAYLLEAEDGTRTVLNVDTEQWLDPASFPAGTFATATPVATP